MENVHTSTNNQKRTINLTIQLVFIGYDEEILDVSVFHELGGLTDYYPYIETINQYNISIQTNLISCGSDYYQSFLNYIMSVANFSARTSELNITLLEEDNVDPTDGLKSDIFYERTGISINATLVLDYLNNYPPISLPKDPWTYELIFLNLSTLDTGSLEHWYDISEIDFDTNRVSSEWYSEYGGLYDRPVAGWGGEGESRIVFFDPSALEAIWYFDWLVTDYYWSYLEYSNPYVYTDLEDYIAEHETYQPADYSLEVYLYNFTYDILYNDLLVLPYAVLTPDVQDLYFEIAIIENFTRGSILQKNLEFIVNSDKIVDAFGELLPFFEIHMNIHWYSLKDYPEIQDLFDNATIIYEDYYQIEVTEGSPQSVFSYLAENLGVFVEIHPDGINFPTLAFLMNKTRMSYYGTRFGGLGGMGWQLIAYQWDRFMDINQNPPVPKTGISDVIIHEAGHTLGFDHPHFEDYWCGEFIDSVMSYYTINSYFSMFERDWLQSLLVQELLFGVINDYEILGQSYSLSSPEAVVNANKEAVALLTQSWQSFKKMDFPLSFTQGREAALKVEALAQIIDQVGIAEDNPSFNLPEPTITDTMESSTIISTSISKTSDKISTKTQSTTERDDISTFSLPPSMEFSETSSITSLPILGFLLGVPILYVYHKRKKNSV